MLKSKISFILITFGILACNVEGKETKESFTINADIKGLEGDTVIISYFDREERKMIVLDSAIAKNGSFRLEGSLEAPMELQVSIQPGEESFSLYAENAEIEITGDVNEVTDYYGQKRLDVDVSGSKIHEDHEDYTSLTSEITNSTKPLNKEYDSLARAYRSAKTSGATEAELKPFLNQMDVLKEEIDKATAELPEITKKFIEDNPNSHYSASLYTWRTNSYTYEQNKANFSKFSEEVKNGFYGKQIKNALDKLKNASPGAKSSDFAAVDINGDSIKLSDFRGQYVLLDFWASWCKPCRAGNPHLLDLYSKYHDKGFEIIGISDDDSNPAAWHKAVKDDEIGVWKHVLRGFEFDRKNFKVINDEISEPYDIHTLPTKILIDPEGTIIGRYGGGGEDDEAMDNKLAEIFGA